MPSPSAPTTAAARPDPAAEAVLSCGEVAWPPLAELLARYGLSLRRVAEDKPIPGSYWGAPEAGLRGFDVFVRDDTPVHSLLHEACHALCMTAERRRRLNRDAGGDDAEENAVCYLQVRLADHLQGVGAERLMSDMDRWGYSFRLGSTRAWLADDAEDARSWLVDHGLLDDDGTVTFRARA